MANNRFPGQAPVPGFGMAQGMPQFVQPGMQSYPMMQQQMMMSQRPMMQQQPGMYPMNMGMRMPPARAPPPYNQRLADNFQQRQQLAQRNTGSAKSEEQLRKEKQFQLQQQKLKQFGSRTRQDSEGKLDPNKLVDSIFGATTGKPKPKKQQQAQAPVQGTSSKQDDDDDGFGEFLGGPTVPSANQNHSDTQSANQNQPTVTNGVQSSQGVSDSDGAVNTSKSTPANIPPQPAQPAQEKKDLMSMMFECSDLTAPQRARTFQKPSLKQLHPVQHSAPVTHHDSFSARRWDHTEELSDLFIQEAVKDEQSMPPKPSAPARKHSPTSKHPPKPPPWLMDDGGLPPVYKHVLEASLVDGQINTDRLYPILLLSGLPKELLGQIWGMCNKTSPGMLVPLELYAILGLIGLAQNNYQITSPDILSRCPHPPVPLLSQQGAAPGPVGQQVAPQSPGQQGAPQAFGQHGAPHFPGQQALPPSSVQQVAPPPSGGQMAPPHLGSVASGPVMNQQPASASAVCAPATLPVTQLPMATNQSGIVGNVEEDDFADFQAAPAATTSVPGSFGDLMNDVKNENRSPLKDQSKYLYSVPHTPDDATIAATMSSEMKHSNVETFFGSDDSSEGAGSPTSLDDEYFDGYKSTDSKPSDSTSQFSTDQSENDDFKNFENYLEEFNRKKQKQDKESPLHRPIPKPKPGTLPQVTPPPIALPTLPLPGQKAQGASKVVSTEEESDFADFQSAPVSTTQVSGTTGQGGKASLGPMTTPGVTSGQLKQVSSNLMLEESDQDKYAALRGLDVDEKPDTSGDLLGPTEEVISMRPAEEEENWADFQEASCDTDQASADQKASKDSHVGPSSAVASSNISCPPTRLSDEGESEWADFTGPVNSGGENSDWSAFSNAGVGSVPVTQGGTSVSLPQSSVSAGLTGMSATEVEVKNTAESDWAGFKGETDDFSDFQSSGGGGNLEDISGKEAANNGGLVNVKKDGLGKSEILNLFKVKVDPLPTIKSRDDEDFGAFESSSDREKRSESEETKPDTVPRVLTSQSSARKSHTRSLSSEGDEDMFRIPPPMDDTPHEEEEDAFGAYSRGYDLGDMMQPKPPPEKERKNIYGLYGVNSNFVVSSAAKKVKPVVAKELEKSPSPDDDSDSISSKDSSFGGKFTLEIKGEDSQSVSSLDFIPTKGKLQELKDLDGADTQSVSSNEYGNFENQMPGESVPAELQSLDSLDLRPEPGLEETAGSQDNLDKGAKESSPDLTHTGGTVSGTEIGVMGVGGVRQASSLPVIGDRYSEILHDVPGSDKHAYEWQRCLSNCCRMVQDANNVFNSISSSAVCNEIINSSQGSEYIQGIVEIYRVVCRITLSMNTAGIHSDKLGKHLKDIDLAWNNLTAFLVGCSVMPEGRSLDFSHGVLLSEDTRAQYQACGVCLLNVDMAVRGQDNSEDAMKLSYAGRQYHTTCANFWINCVDSILPALKLPELL